MNKKGFTLIEVMAVLVILGVVLLIAVPSVSTYIVNSRKSNYYTTANSYVDTIIGYYGMKEFGPLLKKGEMMIVPIKNIKLDKGGSSETPFGDIDYNRSYVVITYNGTKTSYYVNMLDSSGYGIFNVLSDKLDSSSVTNDKDTITSIEPLVSCMPSSSDPSKSEFVINNTLFIFKPSANKEVNYKVTYVYNYGSEFDSENECSSNYTLPVLVLKMQN